MSTPSTPPASATAADAAPTGPNLPALMTDLLEKNDLVVLFVLPSQGCHGLDDFDPDRPLRINLGHGLVPAMNIRVLREGLVFDASFAGRSRWVSVSWNAVLFAGSERNLAEVMAKALRLQQVARRPPPVQDGATSNVVQVDFSKRGAK